MNLSDSQPISQSQQEQGPDGEPQKIASNFKKIATVFLILFSTILLAFIYSSPPKPLPANAPNTKFSAHRARDLLNTLIGDNKPHAVNSSEQRLLAVKITKHLGALGYKVQTQEAIVPVRFKRKLRVRNLMTRLKGQNPGPALLLVSHYDSVPYGPGAGDAGASVASILEIAAILKNRPAPNQDIILLLTDGEEAGLLGAQLFCKSHPWAKDIRVVINLEGRGNSGRSLMFETSDNSLPLIKHYARSISAPATGSLFYAVYKKLPNDTDLTVFKRAGMKGYGFAFIGNAQNYHTKNDTVKNLNLPTLQHQGQNALELLTQLDQNPKDSLESNSEAVFFDIYGLTTIWWPQSRTLPLYLLTLLLFILAFLKQRSYKDIQLSSVLWASLILVLLFIIPIGASLLMKFPNLRARPDIIWPANPYGTLWLHRAPAFLIFSLALLLRSKLKPWSSFWAVASLWLVFTTLLVFTLPAGSYLTLLPCLFLGLALIPSVFKKIPESKVWLLQLVPTTVALVLWLPLEWLFYDALGLAVTVLTPFRAVMLLSLFLPIIGSGAQVQGRPGCPPAAASR
jgi:hypothetical protein